MTAPGLRGLMERTRPLAEADGYAGLEHLLIAIAEGTELEGRELRWRLQPLVPALRAHASALRPRAAGPPEQLQCSPRLARLGETLGHRAGWSGLLGALEELPSHLAAVLEPGLGRAPGSGAATALEVVGGPEDGRRLQPEPGQRIGRWRADAACVELPLYVDSARMDAGLSRSAVAIWLGEGRLRLCAPATLLRARPEGSEEATRTSSAQGELCPAEVELRLEVDDVLVLSALSLPQGLRLPLTSLRACGAG
jgi:hypothetical protein